MMYVRLVAIVASVTAFAIPVLARAQSSTGGTLLVHPADGQALGNVAPSPTSEQALDPRPAPGPMINPGTQFKNGYYRGIVPGTSHVPPRARRLKNTRRNLVVWPGFEMTESGSRLFIQSTRPVTYRRESGTDRIVIILQNTRIHLRNNRNPLLTEHFNTPLATAFLRQRGRDTLLVMEMKVDAPINVRQHSDGNNHFLFVEFPSGQYQIPEGIRAWRGGITSTRKSGDKLEL